jgi:hypothetical protein
MRLVDVNVLVYAHRLDAPRHPDYAAWFGDLLAGQEPYGISDLVLSGFLRIVTNPKVFRQPTPIETALAPRWRSSREASGSPPTATSAGSPGCDGITRCRNRPAGRLASPSGSGGCALSGPSAVLPPWDVNEYPSQRREPMTEPPANPTPRPGLGRAPGRRPCNHPADRGRRRCWRPPRPIPGPATAAAHEPPSPRR